MGLGRIKIIKMGKIKSIIYNKKKNAFIINVDGILDQEFIISTWGISTKVDILAKLESQINERSKLKNIVNEINKDPNF